MYNSVYMAKFAWNFYLAKYSLVKCQIKMQQNFYTPKSPQPYSTKCSVSFIFWTNMIMLSIGPWSTGV